MSTVRMFRPSLARHVLVPLAALGLLALGGCVAYPAYGPGYYGGGYYGGGYAYAPPVVAAPVIVGGGGYYGHYYGRR
jgi:hypothetical protein